MRKFGIGCVLLLGLLVGSCGGILYKWGLYVPDRTVRIKMIAEFETPSGVESFEAVNDIVLIWNQEMMLDRSELDAEQVSWLDCRFRIKGQALIAELGDRQVFLIKSSYPEMPSRKMLELLADRKLASCSDAYGVAGDLGGWFGSGSAEIPSRDWPEIVYFQDLNDRSTGKRLKPDEAGLKRVTIETSWSPLSSGIDRTLPWLARSEPFDKNIENLLIPRSDQSYPGPQSIGETLTFGNFWEDPPERRTGRKEYEQRQAIEREKWLENNRRGRAQREAAATAQSGESDGKGVAMTR